MSRPERRRATRMPICATVEVAAPAGRWLAEMQDLSRPGIRLRLRRGALGFAPREDLQTVVAHIEQTLGTTPTLHVDARDGSEVIEKRVRITRIALPIDAPDHVELGCRFERELDPRQVRVLGLAVPVERDLAQAEGRKPPRPAGRVEVKPPAPVEPPAPDVATLGDPSVEHRLEHEGPVVRCNHRALISSRSSPRSGAILCHADQLSRAAVRVRMSRSGYEGMSVTEAALRIAERHGTALSLKLMSGADPLWTGSVRLYSVEIEGDDEGDVLLTFAFERLLTDDESARLSAAA